jgi:hypothetical protein
LNLKTKTRLNESLKISTLLYAAEIWLTAVVDTKKLEAATTDGREKSFE